MKQQLTITILLINKHLVYVSWVKHLAYVDDREPRGKLIRSDIVERLRIYSFRFGINLLIFVRHTQMGYSSMFFGRLHYLERMIRITNRSMEFVWNTSDDYGIRWILKDTWMSNFL